ncbi:MAG: hypothetical protein Q8R31_03275 [Candidatus Omnitrophota bacterium]|nr:hypothetical protein [Candidatus Omnitrophota bacterium]
MKIEIKNRYSNARLFQGPPCPAIPKDKFITYLKDGVKFVCADKSRSITNIFNSHVNLLKGYLDKYNVKKVVPDEVFFDSLWNRSQADTELNGKRYSPLTAKKISRTIRKIVNGYMYGKLGILKRKILLEVEYGRYERFFKFTKLSQDAVIWF